MYWDRSSDVYCPIIASAFSRARFREIFHCFHLCDNNNLDKNDKVAKVYPLYNVMNARCLKFRGNNSNICVDESMIPYYGRNGCKQRIQNKPIRLGYKMWVLAESNGYVVQFEPYQGAKCSGALG